MVVIGDVHGRIGDYLHICRQYKDTVQVGDLSASFRSLKKILPAKGHRFIRGNHEPRSEIVDMPQWIPDGTYEDGVFYVGSADHVVSTGEPDRVIDYDEWGDIKVKYTETRPSIVISHDCPVTAGHIMDRWDYKPNYTSSWLEQLLQEHVPIIWVFGHWHQSRDFQAEGCNFICLDKLETRMI